MKKNKTQELLKEIPSVDSVIQHFKKKYMINFHFSLLKKIINNEIKLLKSEIINEKKSKNLKELLFSRINEKVTNRLNNSLDSVINGTGIVLHTGLGRAPIDKNILNRVFENIYPYSNLEFNIEKKIKSNVLSKSVKVLGKNQIINRIFTNLADKGILS